MLTQTKELLQAAQANGYAIGAFNVYNLEGTLAVVDAAEAENSPAMLQIHPASLKHGGPPLVALCLTAAEQARVPMSVHLDHCSEPQAIQAALAAGLTSIMADGSHLAYDENVAFTAQITRLVHEHGGVVEAELGRLAGTEDDLTIEDYEARLTDPGKAFDYVKQTNVDMLAVCIGNVHGKYPRTPQFDFERLHAISKTIPLPLVLHGASGVPDPMIKRCIELGISKFNVNTEVRNAYVTALRSQLQEKEKADLLPLMNTAISDMKEVIVNKIRLFGSVDRA